MKRVIYTLLCLVICGCSGVMMSRLDTLRNEFYANDFISAADTFAKGEPLESQDSLELLVSGLSLFQSGDFNASDNAFEIWRTRNYDLSATNILREGGILIGGNMSVEYKPYMMDALFVSYYQMWDAIGAGRQNDVRVIINQSYARQQQMSREYKNLIKENTKSNNTDINKILDDNNNFWGGYTNIMNPALMYLSGIWFLNSGDYSDAETYLTRTSGMTNANKFVAQDLKSAQNKTQPKDTIWVFIESGFAPQLYQQRITFPWLIDGDLVLVPVAIATPRIWGGRNIIPGATQIADVNAMFMTEFKEYQINNVLRDLTAAASRVAIQGIINDSNRDSANWLGLVAGIYSVASTNAEVRSWATLPEYIYVARGTKSDLIDMNMGANLTNEIKQLGKGNHLIYVRMTGNTPVIHTFKI